MTRAATRVSSLEHGPPVLITLTTTGGRSGRPRDVQLYAFEDGDDLIVTGSRGGATIDFILEPDQEVDVG
jgi:hypothetical protein